MTSIAEVSMRCHWICYAEGHWFQSGSGPEVQIVGTVILKKTAACIVHYCVCSDRLVSPARIK